MRPPRGAGPSAGALFVRALFVPALFVLALVVGAVLVMAVVATPALAATPEGPLRAVPIEPGATFAVPGRTSTLSESDIGYIRSISCPAPGTCFGAGSTASATASGQTAAMVTTLSLRRQVWRVARAAADWSDVYRLTSISCTSVSNCAAVGEGRGNEYLVLATTKGSNGEHWAEPAVPFSMVPLESVSCTGAFCMAVGSSPQGTKTVARVIVTSSSAQRGALGEPTWVDAPSLPRGSFDGQTYYPSLDAVSCYSPGHCWVVGGGAWSTADGGRTWQQHSPEATSGRVGLQALSYSVLDAVQFWGADGLVAGGDQCGSVGTFVCSGSIFATHDSGRTWSREQPVRSMPFVEGLSCASAGGPCLATAERYSGTTSSDAGSGRPVATEVLGSQDGRAWQLGSWANGISAPASSCPVRGACLVAGGFSDGPDGAVYDASQPPASSNPEIGSIGASLPSPAKTFSPISADLANAAIAVGAALFITFPANLFNSTFEQNYEDIVAWWLSWRNRLFPLNRKRTRARPVVPLRAAHELTRLLILFLRQTRAWAGPGATNFAAALAGGSLLGSMLDPSFGANLRTVLSFLAIASAMVTGVAIGGLVTHGYHRGRGHGTVPFNLEAVPAGLFVAAACVLVSRGTGFSPGYLYGIICGVTFGRELASNEEAHIVALSALARALLGVAAWLAWAPVNSYASKPGSFFGAVLVDDFLASLFVSGLVSTVISLLPLRFLPGHKLKAWHKGAWAAIFTACLFLLVQVLLRPHGGGGNRTHVPLITTLVLFIVFAGGSVLFREHFARKARSKQVSPTT